MLLACEAASSLQSWMLSVAGRTLSSDHTSVMVGADPGCWEKRTTAASMPFMPPASLKPMATQFHVPVTSMPKVMFSAETRQ